MIDDADKWDDINELRKSIPGLGISVPVDYILDQINIAKESLSKKSEFITKMCNLKQNSTKCWLPAKVIQKASAEEIKIEDFRGCYACAGLDLSQSVDLTSACVVIKKNGIDYIFSHFWLPEGKIEDAIARDGLPYREYITKGWLTLAGENFVDYHSVLEWFIKLVREYEIYPLVVGYDRYSSQYLIKDMEANGFLCDDVYQGHQLYPILQKFEGEIKDGTIKTGKNDLLNIHLLNSAIKMDNEQGRGKLIKATPKDHIDGTAAIIDAYTVASKYYDQYGYQLMNEQEVKYGTI